MNFFSLLPAQQIPTCLLNCQLSFSNQRQAISFSKSKIGIFHSPGLFFFLIIYSTEVNKWPHFEQGKQFRLIASCTSGCSPLLLLHHTSPLSLLIASMFILISLSPLRIPTYDCYSTKERHYGVPQCHSTKFQPAKQPDSVRQVPDESLIDKIQNFNTSLTHIHNVIPSTSVSLYS